MRLVQQLLNMAWLQLLSPSLWSVVQLS